MTLRTVRVAALAAACLLTAGPLAAQASGTLGVDTASFDRSVRPQDDFFSFVNGGWVRNTPMPTDRSRYGSFDILAENSQEALRAIIEEAAAGEIPDPELRKAGEYYHAYMDTTRIEQLGIEPLRDELEHIARLQSAAQLPELFAELQRIGVQSPVGVYVTQDDRDATRYIAYASQSGLGLPDRDYYTREGANFDRIRDEYRRYISTLLKMAGDSESDAAAERIFALEKRIAEHHWERARNRDPVATYNLYAVDSLATLGAGFDWARYLAALDAAGTPGVVVRQPSYFQALSPILAETPVETWRDYLTFKLLDSYADELSSDFVNTRFGFRGRVLSGQQENRPRWKRGVAAAEGAMGEALGREYVARHFTPERKARMDALVRNLVEAFRQGIDELEWMSPETKAAAREKLAKFNVKIGYPEKWQDYSALSVNPGDLVGNTMRAARFNFAETTERLGKPVDRAEWLMTPQTVNAYYHSSLNEIVFPAAILQPPFFDFSADDAVNYGAIGAVIGHEISHGFDDQGRQSDGEGNLRDWWTPVDATAFQERADRLVAQYGEFNPVDDLRVNGRLTLGENIGDLSGLAVAYRAYRLSLGGQEPPVIGGFTGDQRFFLGWAQVWRNITRDETLRQLLLTDPHSPERYRVNGVLPNMPEFYEAFGVKPGDEMYLPPEERVTIW